MSSYNPTTPRKRTFDSALLTPSEPTPSQKRKKIIEEALADQPISTPSKSQARTVHSTQESDHDDDAMAVLTPPSSLSNPQNRPSERRQNSDDPFVVLFPQDSRATGGSSTTYDPGRDTALSPDTISALLGALDGIPEYVRKLERKKIAAEKSSDAKAMKIAELEAEIQKYVVKYNL